MTEIPKRDHPLGWNQDTVKTFLASYSKSYTAFLLYIDGRQVLRHGPHTIYQIKDVMEFVNADRTKFV
mgnify:CR=1 FL=1